MHSDGLLAVARSQPGLHWFELTVRRARQARIRRAIPWLNGDEARDLEPALGEQVRAAMLSDIDRHVDPVSFWTACGRRSEPQDVTVLEGRPVRSLRPAGAGWRVDADGLSLDAEKVVLATALGTRALVAPLGIRLALIGAKGYSADVTGAPAIGRALYLSEAKIGVSPMDGHTRVGGFFEIGATSPRADRRAGAAAAQRDRSTTVPGFPTALPPGDDGMAGLRPSTPDSLPYLGEHPRAPACSFATGHGMLGVSLAPTTATAVAELAAGPSSAWPGSTPSAQIGENGARHRYSAERTESTGGRCRAAVCQLWPPSTEPNSSPEVAPKEPRGSRPSWQNACRSTVRYESAPGRPSVRSAQFSPAPPVSHMLTQPASVTRSSSRRSVGVTNAWSASAGSTTIGKPKFEGRPRAMSTHECPPSSERNTPPVKNPHVQALPVGWGRVPHDGRRTPW